MDIHRVHQFKAGASSLVVPVTDHHVFTIRSRFERKAQSAGAAVLILMFLAMTDAGFLDNIRVMMMEKLEKNINLKKRHDTSRQSRH